MILNGEESYPPLTTIAEVQRREEDILGLQNRLVPIRFGTKSDHDGWYVITDANTTARNYQDDELAAFSWGFNAQRIGPENAVDLESRLDGISRTQRLRPHRGAVARPRRGCVRLLHRALAAIWQRVSC